MDGKFRVLCGDELRPGVGSGHRIVIAKVGRKWVFVKEAALAKRKRFTRVSRAVWDRLQVNPVV